MLYGADLETELLLHRWCLAFSCEKLLKILSSPPLFLSADVEVGLDMGRLVQQSRQRQGLSQKDLAVVSGIVIITDYLRMYMHTLHGEYRYIIIVCD